MFPYRHVSEATADQEAVEVGTPDGDSSGGRQLGEAQGKGGALGDVEVERPAPTHLVTLLATILFLYVGIAVGYGAWVTVAALRDELGSETEAVRLAR